MVNTVNYNVLGAPQHGSRTVQMQQIYYMYIYIEHTWAKTQDEYGRNVAKHQQLSYISTNRYLELRVQSHWQMGTCCLMLKLI